MIVIIKKGTREVTTCNTCGCKFSYEKEDVKNGDTDNYKRWEEYVLCPQCSCEVILRQTSTGNHNSRSRERNCKKI